MENECVKLIAHEIFGIGFHRFDTLTEAADAPLENLSWLVANKGGLYDADDLDVFVPDGIIPSDNITFKGFLNDEKAFQNDGIWRYSILYSLLTPYEKMDLDDPLGINFEIPDGESFDSSRLRVKYSTAVYPGRQNLKLVSSVEYDGREVFVADFHKNDVGELLRGREFREVSWLIRDGMYMGLAEYRSDEGGRWRILTGIPKQWERPHGEFVQDRSDGQTLVLMHRPDGNIPEGTETIQSGAFQDSDVNQVTIPRSVKDIADLAFYNCSNLEHVYISEGERLLINPLVFFKCNNLRAVKLRAETLDTDVQEGVLGEDITHLLIPDPIDAHSQNSWIEDRFLYRLWRRALILGDSIIEGKDNHVEICLDARQFQYVSSIVFGRQVCNCDSVSGRWLLAPEFDAVNALLQFGAALIGGNELESDLGLAMKCYTAAEKLCTSWLQDELSATDEEEELLRSVRARIVDLKERFYVVPDEFIHGGTIDQGTGAYQDDITALFVPEGVRKIGDGAFRGCRNLRYLYLPDSVEEIGEFSLRECPRLLSRKHVTLDGRRLIVWPNVRDCVLTHNIHSVGAGAFNHAELIHFEWMRQGKTCSIGSRAFSGCGNLSDVTIIGAGFVSIGRAAFLGCTHLSHATFHGVLDDSDSIVDLASYCFEGCTNLSEVRAEALIVQEDFLLGVNAVRCFSGCESLLSLPTISFPHGVVSEECFSNCTRLEGVEIDGSSNDIFMFERSVFSGCRRLRRLMFVESLRRRGIRHALNMRVQLGACAFANCVELRRDNLAFSEIVEMAPDAFAGCVNLDR